MNLEKGDQDSRCCCLERHVGHKEQQSLQVVNIFGKDLMVFVSIITVEVCKDVPLCASPSRGHNARKDAANLNEESERIVRWARL